ncbi:MAG: 30S ribosomal protein S2 [Candidatus Anstonellaceae archaeon]
MSDSLLIKQEKYLESGIHIGTKIRTIDMQKFIFKKRSDGLYVLDLRVIDERLKIAAKIISKYDPKKVYVIASRTYSSMTAKAFEKLTSINAICGRFIPGRMTNIGRKDFIEPELVIICDPKGERQAVIECGNLGIPTIGLCDTDNFTFFIDWIIPCNNKGRKSLSLIFWLLARELAMSSNKISSYDEFKPDLDEFEVLCSQFLDEESKKQKEENEEEQPETISEEIQQNQKEIKKEQDVIGEKQEQEEKKTIKPKENKETPKTRKKKGTRSKTK